MPITETLAGNRGWTTSSNIETPKGIGEMLDEQADLGSHRLRPAVHRDPPQRAATFPILQNRDEGARPQFIFDIAGGDPNDSTSGEACLLDSLEALNQQLWEEPDLLSLMRFDEGPLTMDVALDIGGYDTSVPKEIGRHERNAGPVEIFGRRTCNHLCLKEFANDEALGLCMRSAALAQAASAK